MRAAWAWTMAMLVPTVATVLQHDSKPVAAQETSTAEAPPPIPASRTPCEELYRETTGQLADGAVLEMALKYRQVGDEVPRHNH